jgi:hypothetical protein
MVEMTQRKFAAENGKILAYHFEIHTLRCALSTHDRSFSVGRRAYMIHFITPDRIEAIAQV